MWWNILLRLSQADVWRLNEEKLNVFSRDTRVFTHQPHTGKAVSVL